MDYKKILHDLEDFAEKEYLKLTEQYPVIIMNGGRDRNSPIFEHTILGQDLRNVDCKITFNYSKVSVRIYHGDEGSGYGVAFDGSVGIFDKNEEYIKAVMRWKSKPFRVRTKTVKFTFFLKKP